MSRRELVIIGMRNSLFAVYWQIKRISVDNKNDPNKFDNMIRAIRQRKSVPGYSTVLWDVRFL